MLELSSPYQVDDGVLNGPEVIKPFCEVICKLLMAYLPIDRYFSFY